MSNHLKKLNPEQYAAVTHAKGRLLILAGAGSGKTHVLTSRMVHLVLNEHIPPQHILGLTFTNKAAKEMRQRLALLLDAKSAKSITLCTFHSLCMHILRKEIHLLGYTSHFSLYDEKDIRRLVTTLVRDITGIQGELPSLEDTWAVLQDARNKGLSSDQIQDASSLWHQGLTQELYSKLQVCLRAYNAVDFDQLLTLTVELFEKFPAVLDRYQELYRYIMIDEYQDTNPIQYRLAQLLSAKYQNLCVVGDDDQSIYGWRGADIKGILSFDQARIITLQQNYRSTNTILQAANAVIIHNKQRHQKVLWSENGIGEKIEVFHAPTAKDEAEALACRLVLLKEKKQLAWRDIAILYRSNSLARLIETALLKQSWKNVKGEWIRGVPYQVYGGSEFYQRREIKDLISYLRVLVNPTDHEALLRIINVPRRGIGEGTLDLLTAFHRSYSLSLWEVIHSVLQTSISHPELQALKNKIQPKTLSALQAFVNLLTEAKEHFIQKSLFQSMQWFVEAIQYKRAIHEEVKSDQMRAFKWSNVEEFIVSLQEFEKDLQKIPDSLDLLNQFISSVTLDDTWKQGDPHSTELDTVHLMTFHSAKGLEFPACFLIGMEDHIIPHEKSLLQTGIEEERRLMYVALTRAKSYLTVSMARQRDRLGKEEASKPSRFLFDIPKELLRLTEWNNPIYS